MKTASIFICLIFGCTILLLNSCAAFQNAQMAGASTAPTMWGSNSQGNSCPHHRYDGGMTRLNIYSIRNEYATLCYKCGRYVRGNQ